MDYQKLDAALASALARARPADTFLVTIQTNKPPDPKEAESLARFGVPAESVGRSIFSATLNPEGVSVLSLLPVVKSIKLAQQLDYLKGQ